MKNLYLILEKGKNPTTFGLLKKSAEKRNLKVIPVYIDNFDFSRKYKIGKKDAIYRISKCNKAILVEKYLMKKGVSTFYTDIEAPINRRVAPLLHQKKGLPIVDTIFDCTRDRALLKKYVKKLGGFPIVVKILGGSHGVGVIKVSDFECLNSLADYLCKQKKTIILRKFIDFKQHARLIVLGNKVISSIEYERIDNDFRTNVGEKLKVKKKNFGREIENIAVAAVSALGLEFGGVDILIDKNGSPYIAEANFPCYFPRTQLCTKVDISGAMIDFLIEKSK